MTPRTRLLLLRASFFLDVLFLSSTGGFAQTVFVGANTPGSVRDIQLTVGAATTNYSMSISGSATTFSHLLIKAGGPPSATNFDFIAAAEGQVNALRLERPDLKTTNYTLRVRTPTNSLTHSYTITVTTNEVDLRTATKPVTKSLISSSQGRLGPNAWHYFRVDVSTNVPGWKLTLSSSNSIYPDLYVQRGQVPTTSTYLRRSQSATNDVMVFSGNELTPGVYLIGVYQPASASGTNAYTLQAELVNFTTLNWDPGTTDSGTQVYSSPSTNGGDYYFKITTVNSAVGGWRTALNVTGEADLYLSKGTAPTATSFQYKSDRVGADGFVLPSSAFSPGEDWYLLVRAAPGSSWSLVSGEPYVGNLGVIAADGSSGSGNVAIGPEGVRFFKTTAPPNLFAWGLWLGGPTNNILVRKLAIPVPALSPLPAVSDLSQPAQLLVVPGYLVGGQLYFVGVAGSPGTSINLTSRQHSVLDIPFQSTNSVTVTGFGYTTYRTIVPTNQLAWQVNVVANSGNPNVAIRRNLVPNESNNDAYSDVGGLVTDSITLVPPTLSDGTFYVTVYGTNAHSFTLQSGIPVVTDINFVSATLNTDTNRVGWRFFRVSDISQQVGSLGWDLFLTNHSPGTRIALRRNAVPGIWNFRNPNQGSSGFHDALSAADFLQRPGHQADVWYVGVYNPTNALRNFTLITRDLTPETMSFDNATSSRSGVVAGKWQYFRIVVPANAIGWDLRLNNVTSGSPQLYVRRELLPTLDAAALAGKVFSPPVAATNWPSGNQWAAGKDWTERDFSTDGSVNESGRVLTMGLGRPLESGATYYVGVINTPSTTNAMNYTVTSRGIGNGLAIPVTDLPYGGGSVAVTGLAPRELACYRVVVPSNAPTWKVKLTPTLGDAVLAVGKDKLPNISASINSSVTNTLTPGKKMLSLGNEHFVQLPGILGTNLFQGTNYLVVVGEGVVEITNRTRIGTGTTSFSLQSLGAMPEIDLGLLGSADLLYNGQLEGGESAAFRFRNTGDTLGFEISLENRVGNPVAVSGEIPLLLGDPGSGEGVAIDYYGNEGGVSSISSPGTISVANPFADETIMVKARLSAGDYPDASYTLRVRKLVAQSLAFDGGAAVVSDHSENWRFFRVDVPPGAVGWDIRITDVQSGLPQMVVCRDFYGVSTPFGTSPGFSPGAAMNWLPGYRWAAGQDWTQRSSSYNGLTNETGRILGMGVGRPLEPGTYYVGIKNNNSPSTTMSYTVRSRGIGAGFSIPIVDLPFGAGPVTNAAIAPREAAYYRTVIPAGASSWRVRLTAAAGESMLLALSNAVPSVLTGRPGAAGKSIQKNGNEHYLLLPGSPQSTLAAGTNYLAVVSEGVVGTNFASRIGTGTSSYIIESKGELPVIDMGVAGGSDLVQAGALEGGEIRAYQFSAPTGLSSLEVRLENTTGSPTMVVRVGPQFPNPGAASTVTGNGSVGADDYGNEGGYAVLAGQGNSNTNLVTLANPTNGLYTVMVKARPTGGVFTNATYTLRVRALDVTLVDFDDGFSVVTNQAAGSWRYFLVDVPDGISGWDVRLANVTAGLPRVVVRRDLLPDGLTTKPWGNPGTSTNWPPTNQWSATSDWTRRPSSSDGLVIQDGRILAMGVGQPLEPGSYYIGVINSAASASMSYTLVSRGISENLSIPVTDLAFDGGSASVSDLAPREAAYFRVNVPSDTSHWKVKLAATSGESMLVVLKDHVPNILSGNPPGGGIYGKILQKAGDEHYLLLPQGTQTNLAAGTYYLAVVSEGLNPGSATRIGTGSSSFTITSEGTPAIPNLGAVGPVDLVQSDALEGGESKLYQFSVPSGIPSFEVLLEVGGGKPVVVLRADDRLVNPGAASTVTGPGSVFPDDYGHEGGATITPTLGNANSSLITMPNPTGGLYTIAVKARNTTPGIYPGASYTLRVRQIPVPQLNFTNEQNTNGLNHSATGQLLNNQSAFYKVEVPSTVNGAPVIGWELDAAQSSGLASIRVRKDFLPTDATTGMPFVSASAIIAPPFLTNGTWYVEVRGSNSTSFTLTSKALLLQRPAWKMPGFGEPVTTPGLSAPDFGDTGLDTNGVPLPGPVDRGTDLQNGYYHFYAVDVPTNNAGLLRVQLEAISGNPDLYLRTNQVPTASHQLSGIGGGPPLADRTVTGSTTEYPNWVPVNGKTETLLRPGRTYLAVRAAGNANARYRLRLSVGNVQDLALDGGNLSNQSVSGGDWRYYRVVFPSDAPPVNWSVTFNQQAGDVVLYLRDTIPPGNGTSITDYRDWVSDQKNAVPNATYDAPGTYTFTIPPVRPGAVYFLGFRAKNDATFSVSSAVSGGTMPVLPTIDFYGGTATNTIPPNGQAMYRIIAPPDASRWKHTSIHSNVVRLFLANGTLATPAAYAWTSGGANSALDQYLNAWPWIANVSYYLLVTNSSAVPQPFQFAMNGKSVITDDSDNDGLPDRWEYQYFGALTQTANADPDGDGVSNLSEYREGTIPSSNTSLRPRLTITANNGSVTVQPVSSNYAYGTVVTLTPVPNLGFGFAGWSGDASGTDSPLNLVMDGSKSLVADFKVPGDDFVQRIAFAGFSAILGGSNAGASREPGEPSHAGTPGGSSVWWTWTAPFSSLVTIGAAGSGFSPALGVYVGDSVSTLAVITSDIGGGGPNSSRVSFLAEAGIEYQIAVDGVDAGTGAISLSLAMDGLFALTDVAQQQTGVFEFTVLGPNGQTVRIDATTDFITWITLTNLINTGGTIHFVDPDAATSNSRYYRAVAP